MESGIPPPPPGSGKQCRTVAWRSRPAPEGLYPVQALGTFFLLLAKTTWNSEAAGMLALIGGNMRNSVEFCHCEDMSPYPQGNLPDKIKVGRNERPNSYLHDSNL